MEPHGGRIIFGIMGLMTVYRCRSFVFLVFLLILGPLARVVLTAHPQGPQRVPVPVPPTAKPGAARSKADRSNLPAIPTFKDVAKDVGLTAVHIAAPEAHYVIDSTSGGVGLFDCDDDGRLDVLLINGSTVERVRAGGDPLVTLYHQEPNGAFKDITKEAGLTRRGGGTFEEVSVKAGVHDYIGYYGLGVMWVDYDDDGWPDLLVANDSVPNYLYHNNRNGTFTDMGMITGLALSGEGMELGNMGVDWGDYDHSGRLSFFVTHFEEQPNSLYRNLGPKGFDDVSWTSGVGQPSYPYVGWGTGFFDMDNDTWLDLFVANGHVYPQIDTIEVGPRYKEPMLLHRNNRDGTFDEVSKEAGLQAMPLKSRRGAAFGDIFNTGNIDIVVLNVGEPPSVLLNTNRTPYHRVLFKLIGTKSNRAAIGARVTIHAAGVKQFHEVQGGGSYLSQNDLRLHFGLGAATKMDSVEIRWPNGATQTLQNVPADAIYTIVEGAGIRDTKALPPPGAGASVGAH